jgi:translation initiation factor IF-1
MPGADACVAAGVIVDVIRPGIVRVELPNGHRLVARRLRRDAERATDLRVGSEVQVSVSPADPAKGILMVERI